jgi:hypothetical protein
MKSSRLGRTHVSIIFCVIPRLRQLEKTGFPDQPCPSKQETDEGIRIIKIEGSDYRIPEETLLKYLRCYGEVLLEVIENLFDSGGVLDSINIGHNLLSFPGINYKSKINDGTTPVMYRNDDFSIKHLM